MKNLEKLFNECKMELDNIGIEYGDITDVTINTRAKKRWGQCRQHGSTYSINISVRLLQDDVSDIATKNTIIHEILHTCEGGMCHTGEWKRLANLVNDCYSCYNIKTKTSSKEKGIEPEPIEYKYELRCKKCGKVYRHQRMCKSVKYPEWYRCGVCGGDLERIK